MQLLPQMEITARQAQAGNAAAAAAAGLRTAELAIPATQLPAAQAVTHPVFQVVPAAAAGQLVEMLVRLDPMVAIMAGLVAVAQRQV
jgi:hypothetical protein